MCNHRELGELNLFTVAVLVGSCNQRKMNKKVWGLNRERLKK